MPRCLQCGRWHNYEDDYCSQKCFDEATAKKCDWCGGLVLRWPPYIFNTKTYCSEKCRSEATAGYRSNNTSYNAPSTPPQVVYTTFPDDAWAEYQKGIGFFNNGSYNDAVNSYTKAINMGCHHPNTYGYRGEAYLKLGKYQSAIADSNKALELLNDGNNYYEPEENLSWIWNRGVAYTQIADYTNAFKDFDYYEDYARGKEDYEFGRMKYCLGFVYWKLGDKKKAKMQFTYAVKWQPNNAEYKAALKGKVPEQLFQFQEPQNAQPQQDEAPQTQAAQTQAAQAQAAQPQEDVSADDDMDLDSYVEIPDEAMAEYHKAEEFNKKGEYEKAVDAYTKAIRLGACDSDTYGHRGKAYGNWGKFELAVSDFTKAIEILNGNVNYYHDEGIEEWYRIRGVNYREMGDYKRALEDFTETIKIHDNDEEDVFDDAEKANPYFGRGNVYMKTGDTKKAVADFKKAVKLAPDNEKYIKALEEAGGGEVQEEITKIKADAKAKEDLNKDPKKEFDNAQVLLFSGKYDKAVDSFTKAIKLGKVDSDVYGYRGDAYLSLGKHDLAITDLTKAIEILDSGDEELFGLYDIDRWYCSRGTAYKESGDTKNAVADFKKAVQLDPDNEKYKTELQAAEAE